MKLLIRKTVCGLNIFNNDHAHWRRSQENIYKCCKIQAISDYLNLSIAVMSRHLVSNIYFICHLQ